MINPTKNPLDPSTVDKIHSDQPNWKPRSNSNNHRQSIVINQTKNANQTQSTTMTKNPNHINIATHEPKN